MNGKKVDKTPVKDQVNDITAKLQKIQQKKQNQVKETDKPTVEDFLSLIEKLKLKTVPIKGGYIAIKTLKGKCITYLRPTKYGFSFESKNDKGNWVVERISQQSQLADKVKVIQQRLK